VKIEVPKHQPRKNEALVQSMSDLPVSDNKEPSAVIKNIAVVQCEGFRCLAYQDGKIWRDFQTGKELPEVKSIVFTFSV
jgi:hypothetical protein